MKRFSVVALIAALGLLGWAVSAYRLETKPVPQVVVESPELDLGERSVGKFQIVFRVTNPSNHPAEVLGAPEVCGKSCCFKLLAHERQVVPPGGSVDVVCEFSIITAGSFEFSGSLFLNDNGLRVVELTVRGVGVAPAGKTNDPPKK